MGMTTITDIYNYVNSKLVQDELHNITDIIEYLDECQQKIAEKSPIEATPISYNLDETHYITLPDDFQHLGMIKYKKNSDSTPITIDPEQVWGNKVTFPINYTSGEVILYYYKRPAILSVNTPLQIPEIDPRYFYTMGQYAAQMYYMQEDDQAMKDAFKATFFEGLTLFNTSKNFPVKFKNIW